ncbi:MAG: ABC transporter permease [Acidimicrobiia bacterium]
MIGSGNTVGLPVSRSGASGWASHYMAMLRWEILGSRLLLPLMLIVQVLVGAGFVIGFGLLIPGIDADMALYLSTGAVVMSLLLIGLVLTPQLIAQQKMDGSYDFLRALPVPRSAATMASVTLAALIAIPGVMAAMGVAVWRYDISFVVSPAVIPAFALTLLCGCLIGTAVAHGVDEPQVTLLFTQLAIFFIIGFSPVSFPIDRLPPWLATVHEFLPFHHMAVVVRSSLTSGLVVVELFDWLMIVAWIAVTGAITGAVLTRRK